MKKYVDIVSGSCARELIGTMIRSEKLADQELLVLLRQTDAPEFESLPDVHVVKFSEAALNAAFLADLLRGGQTRRVIVEHSGQDSARLVDLLESAALRRLCRIHKVFCTVDCTQFMALWEDRQEACEDQLETCDITVLYHSADCTAQELSAVTALIGSITPKAGSCKADLHNSGFLDEHLTVRRKSPFDVLLLTVALVTAAYLLYQLYRAFLPQLDTSQLQNLVTVFLSILYEAFPFILIGVLISSFIQVLIPAAVLERLFTKSKPVGYLAALFAGVVFPVCDCATVPVVARLVRKGVPASIAVTFYLAAPIVNPIVIASTLYAFPGQPSVALLRVALGLVIALIVGLIMPDSSAGILRMAEPHTCDGCCANGHHHSDEGTSRLLSVLRHAAEEFFEVGVYLIVGALASSAIQTFVPKSIMAGLGSSIVLSILAMMLAAFILSVCSTSDAFIGRTLAGSLPMTSVMGFLVLGPMLDLKNLLLLLSNFNRRFVIKLVSTVTVVAFFVLLTFTFSL